MEPISASVHRRVQFSTNSGGPFNNTLVLTSPEVDIVILQALYPVVRSMSGSVPCWYSRLMGIYRSAGPRPAAISVPVTGDGVNYERSGCDRQCHFINTDGQLLQGERSVTRLRYFIVLWFRIHTVSGFATGYRYPGSIFQFGWKDFSVSTGLSSNTTYYYYAYLTNSNGTIYGAINSFPDGNCSNGAMHTTHNAQYHPRPWRHLPSK